MWGHTVSRGSPSLALPEPQSDGERTGREVGTRMGRHRPGVRTRVRETQRAGVVSGTHVTQFVSLGRDFCMK